MAAVLAVTVLAGCGAGAAGPQAPQAAAGISADTSDAALLTGEFWRDQGLRDVLPYWTRYGKDEEHGAFFALLDRTWQPQGDLHKYPGMVSRHLFSYATAYLLSGDEAHLREAEEIFDYLIRNGWDAEYGGWYDEVDRAGAVVETTKDLFNQAYAITGLAMYYFVTHDGRAKDYIDRSMEILEEHAWDEEHGGYVRTLSRDLSVLESRKDFAPQIAPVSGYLMYLYPATRDPDLLRTMEEIMGVVLERTRDEETGWVTGRFDEGWKPMAPRDQVRVNVGHNLETAWLLMRLYLLTGNEEYRQTAVGLANDMEERAFQTDGGAWAHQLDLVDGAVSRETTPWWIQAYGNMTQLYQYRVTGETRHLDVFRAGAAFWNHAFLDTEYGATYLSAFLDGRLDRGDKGVRTKTSYHTMEFALLTYLYLNLWVRDRPAQLHFRVAEPAAGERLYPSPLEGPDIRIARVEINGREWTDFDARNRFINLPDRGPARITVLLARP